MNYLYPYNVVQNLFAKSLLGSVFTGGKISKGSEDPGFL
tara:strand:+ start:626 stop:742 length:117 start_codon:yes stop_codon:yes gene_type:complete